jgi:hypothetical protein
VEARSVVDVDIVETGDVVVDGIEAKEYKSD